VNRVSDSGRAESIKAVSGESETIKEVSKEVRVFTEDDHLSACTPEVADLYEALKARILSLGSDVQVVPRQQYVAFQAGRRNVVDVHLAKKHLKLWINLPAGSLQDPLGLARSDPTPPPPPPRRSPASTEDLPPAPTPRSSLPPSLPPRSRVCMPRPPSLARRLRTRNLG